MNLSNINTEQIVLKNLLNNEEYTRKVLPFIDPNYFEGFYKKLYLNVGAYVGKYNKLPSLEELKIYVDESNWSEEEYNSVISLLPSLFDKSVESDEKWLLDLTEKWCQDRAIFNAIMESITVIDGKHKTLTKNALPDILTKALAVSFDTNIGHDYLNQASDRYEYYHSDEPRLPFDLEKLNTITNGGLMEKTLNVILAGTGVGKSLAMCHLAASTLARGKNVLYITLEMSEERIAERIDANLMDIPLNELSLLDKPSFLSKVASIKRKSMGNLIIKEYPTGQGNANHFRSLLNELHLKKNFKPDLVFIDYLNICASARMKSLGGNIGSYNYVKAIAEELRGLAIEQSFPLVTATQTTRSGYDSTDVSLTDTSESFGLPMTADLFIAMVSSEELEAQGLVMIKQLKNRYSEISENRRFVLGIDKSKMKLFDAEFNNDTNQIEGDIPIFDKTTTNSRFDDFKIDDDIPS